MEEFEGNPFRIFNLTEEEMDLINMGYGIQKRIDGILIDLKKADFDPEDVGYVNSELLKVDW